MKNYRIEMKWAAVFTVVSIVWLLIEKMTGLHGAAIGKQPIYSLIFAIPAVTIYVLALLDKKTNAMQGQMSWKEGVVSGIILSVFIAVLSPVAQWVGYTMISPEFFSRAVKYYVDNHRMTEVQALEYFNINSFFKKAVYDALSMGVITSAIVALILQTKNKKP